MINYEELLEKYKTPFYLFDSETLNKRMEYLRRHLPNNTSLCYSVKANSFIVKELETLADRLEVCSPGETQICLDCGIPEEKLVVSGVYKPREYLEFLIAKHPKTGIFTVESVQQYELLKELSAKHSRHIEILLRLTSGNQFGINQAMIQSILFDKPQFLNIRGIQFFSGTQKFSLKKLEREISFLDSYLTKLKEQSDFCPQELEFGPGFPAAYFEEEKLDEETYLTAFCEMLESMKNKPLLTLEMGRGIAASCGTYFTSVVDTKCNQNENYAIVDGGIHQLAYYGQVMAMKTPKHRLLPQPRCGTEKKWNICGSLCTANDILIKQLAAKDLKVGDVLAFENAGAYCPTEGMALFLSHELPGIVLRDKNGDCKLLRKPIKTSNINKPML